MDWVIPQNSQIDDWISFPGIGLIHAPEFIPMSHTYDKYLECQMPADPVRELELSIKKEREDEIAAQIKSEPRFDIPEKKRRNPNQTFKCRICPAEFKSKYAFTVHFNKEMIF